MTNPLLPTKPNIEVEAHWGGDAAQIIEAWREDRRELIHLFAALHTRHEEPGRCNPYCYNPTCHACGNPSREEGHPTQGHFMDSDGALRCTIAPVVFCMQCNDHMGQPVPWPCETADLIERLLKEA